MASVSSKSRGAALSVAKRRRGGMALLVVLVLTVLIAIAAYEFTFYMESQYRASRIHEEQTQARFAAMSGIEVAAAVLELPPADRNEQGGLSNNSELFASITAESPGELTANDSRNAAEHLWRCSIVSSAQEIVGGAPENKSATSTNAVMNESFVRFGMVNESAKLHIPTLLAWDQLFPGHAENVLMNLPGATQANVRAWLQTIRQNAAGESRIQSLRERMEEAGSSSSGPVTSDELQMLWFGSDLNRNYRLDPLEIQLLAQLDRNRRGSAESKSNTTAGKFQDSSDAATWGGWSDYLSWHNGHRNCSYLGQARVDLNQDDLQNLQRELSAIWPTDWVNFVIAYRQFGATKAADDSAVQADALGEWIPDFNQSASHLLNSPLDLVDVQVSVPTDNESGTPRNRLFTSPFQSLAGDAGGAIHDLLDESATESAAWIRGRIDISEARLPVLLGIPGVDEVLAEKIVNQRVNLATSPERLSTVAWLLDVGVAVDRLRMIEPYVSGRSDVYSVQSVGFRDVASPVFRCTAIIDACQRPARGLDFQTWHEWGSGFSTTELQDSNLR